MQISSRHPHSERLRILIPLFLVAAVAWLVTVVWARDMGVMPGTMGMSLLAFLIMWMLMMAAMMLPSAAPMITLYSRTLQARRYRRLVVFVAGYVLAWALSGLPAFALAWGAGRIATSYPSWATGAAAVIFAICGIYQLTPIKDRCLRHCRTPFGHLLHYGSYRGTLRDLRAGAHHGAFCLGCCWGLMLLMVAFGVMNLAAMAVLATVVAIEKQWSHGATVARIAGVVALVLALVVVFFPELAPGLNGTMMNNMDGAGM